MNQEDLGVTGVPVVQTSLISSRAGGDRKNHAARLMFPILGTHHVLSGQRPMLRPESLRARDAFSEFPTNSQTEKLQLAAIRLVGALRPLSTLDSE